MPKTKTAPKGFSALRTALLAQKKKSKQWLSAEVARRTRHAPMTVSVAQAVVAHHNGLRVGKYLTGGDLADVQQAIRDLAATPTSVSPVADAPANGRRRSR